MPFPCPAADGFDKHSNASEHVHDVRHDIDTVHENRRSSRRSILRMIPQRHVQDSPIFRRIDLGAGNHGLGFVHDTLLRRELVEKIHRVGRHAVLGVIEEDFTVRPGTVGSRQLEESIRIFGKEIRHGNRLHGLVIMGLQRRPGGRRRELTTRCCGWWSCGRSGHGSGWLVRSFVWRESYWWLLLLLLLLLAVRVLPNETICERRENNRRGSLSTAS